VLDKTQGSNWASVTAFACREASQHLLGYQYLADQTSKAGVTLVLEVPVEQCHKDKKTQRYGECECRN
jgi:hypothetical protein